MRCTFTCQAAIWNALPKMPKPVPARSGPRRRRCAGRAVTGHCGGFVPQRCRRAGLRPSRCTIPSAQTEFPAAGFATWRVRVQGRYITAGPGITRMTTAPVMNNSREDWLINIDGFMKSGMKLSPSVGRWFARGIGMVGSDESDQSDENGWDYFEFRKSLKCVAGGCGYTGWVDCQEFSSLLLLLLLS